MKEILGKGHYDLADYFDACRVKRNITDYDCAGSISKTEAQELSNEVDGFLGFVLEWLKLRYPGYVDDA